jgi:UDP-galactopyranose mutase
LKYKKETKRNKHVLFCGRLAEYQYYNMDQVVGRSLRQYLESING